MAFDTFKAQLKAAAKTLGVTNLSNKRIDAYAATLEEQNPNLSTDDDHKEKVNAFLKLVNIKEVAAYDDWQVTKSKKDNKQEDKKDDNKNPEEKVETPADDPNMPAWAKTLIEQNKTLAETVTKLQAKENKQTMQEKLKELIPDVPPSFYKKWQLPEKDEDVETFTEDVKKEWADFTKENPVQQSSGGNSSSSHVPGRGKSGTDDKASKEEVDAIVNNIM